MTDETKANIIKLFDGAVDKEEQIQTMTKMKFGTKREIIDVLHESGRALNIIIRKEADKKEKAQDDRTIEVREDPEPERVKFLPLPMDVKQLLIDELEGIDNAISELNEIIQAKEEEKRKLEVLYKHIVEVINN